MKRIVLGLLVAMAAATSATAQVSLDFSSGRNGSSISIHLSSYPQLVAIPGYPVYYSPRTSANYFFYDGLYWVFESDNWYASDWYNGPWDLVDPYDVPVFLLRIPVRYYRAPPVYFRGWSVSAAPRWDEHYGRDWNARRSGWDKWNRKSVARPAPLPSYQRGYSGQRYPQQHQQQSIRTERYSYTPRDSNAQQAWQKRARTDQRRAEPQDDRREDDRGRNQGNDQDRDRGNERGNDRGNDRGNGRGDDKR
jgi:hypothetical protein